MTPQRDLAALIESMPDEQRAGALMVLDYLSRPMMPFEIAAHLRRTGISQARAKKIAAAVYPLHIVAMIGEGAA